MNPVYFDFAAATPLDDAAKAAMEPYWQQKFYNPSGLSLLSKDVKHSLEEIRSSVAKTLGIRPVEVVFTAGGSEANNLAILGIAKRFPDAEIITSSVEHDSVINSVKTVGRHVFVEPNKKGLIDAEAVQGSITDKTVLVSIMLVNNEIGTKQPVGDIADVITQERQRRQANGNKLPIYLHTDAAQAPNFLEINPSKLGVDLMTLNGGKIYGPKQSGILYVKAGIELEPLIYGGGQEWGKRSGTENVAACAGFSAALNKAQKKRKSETKRLLEIQKYMIKELSDIESVTINGSIKRRIPNNLHFSIAGKDNERLLYELEEQGFIVAIGSACSASDDEPSHVLSAIGLTDSEARSSLRLSFGRTTTMSQARDFIDALRKLLEK